MSRILFIAAVSYLLGSIPFGYLLVRIFRHEDVRQSGSGNIGATNVSRKSPALGALTLLLDALKGTAAVGVAYLISGGMISGGTIGSVEPRQAMAVAAFFAVLGHVFPVWLKFRGGKGVATGLGSFILIAPKSVLVAAAIFVAAVMITRYVSLASILAVASFPLLVYEFRAYGNAAITLACVIITSLLIIVRHHENVRRLLEGTESRMGRTRA